MTFLHIKTIIKPLFEFSAHFAKALFRQLSYDSTNARLKIALDFGHTKVMKS